MFDAVLQRLLYNAKQFVDAQISKLKGDYDNYHKKHFRTSKIKFLEDIGKTAEAEKLIQQSMDIVEVRLEQVNKAIAKKDYAAAKQLIAEGIKIAQKKDHPGTVADWQKVLLQIAVIEKDIDTIRYYTKHFAVDCGFAAEYYKQWKATYPPGEWKDIINQYIADTLAKMNAPKSNNRWGHNYISELYNLAPIYIQEKYWERLLALVQKENDLSTTL